MTALQDFATAFDIAEQIACWPGERYEGDAEAWDTWMRAGMDAEAEDLAVLNAIVQDRPEAPISTAMGGYGPGGSRVWVGEGAGYAYLYFTCSSTSCDVALLRFPDGHVVWQDSLKNSGAFTPEEWKAMPAIAYTVVQHRDEEPEF